MIHDPLDSRLHNMLADGEITLEDADAIETFSGFLSECGVPYGVPGFDRDKFRDAWKKYYPEDYERAIQEIQDN